MTCSCNCDPCTCVSVVLPTLCDLDRHNNVWVEGADAEGRSGICLLDTIDECQLTVVLQRDPVARTDLLRVTSNAYLRNMVATLPMLPSDIEGDKLQKTLNQETTTLYTVFRGVPPFNQ